MSRPYVHGDNNWNISAYLILLLMLSLSSCGLSTDVSFSLKEYIHIIYSYTLCSDTESLGETVSGRCYMVKSVYATE